jgi:hypothetical protein
MTVTQAAKAQQFRALHEAPDAFVVANVWDGGSARMMAALGFAALATSSGASAGLTARARSSMDKPGKTQCVSPPTGRRLPTASQHPATRRDDFDFAE